MTSFELGEAAAIATAVLWTLSAVAWTSAGKYVGAIPLSFIRLVIGCVPLMVYGQLTRGHALPTDTDGRTWAILGVSGVLGFFVSDICLFKAFLLIGPRLALLIQALTPPLAALITWGFLGDPLGARQWLAMGVVLSGITWVVLEQSGIDPKRNREPRSDGQHGEYATKHKDERWYGVVLAVVAAGAQAFSMVSARYGIGDFDAAGATLLRILPSLAAYIVLITVVRRWGEVAAAARNRRAMVILILGAMVGPFAGVIFCMIALRNCHAGVVSTILATMPVLILPFSILLFGEKVSLRAVGGALISFAGVALLVLRPSGDSGTPTSAPEPPRAVRAILERSGAEHLSER